MSQIDWFLQVNLKARQLRLLVALADFGNLKQVAEISHVTLAAVSKALSEIEKGLGLELFTRTSRGLQPTAYGDAMLRHARRMLDEIHRTRDELKAIGSGSQGRVDIGVFPASTSVLLPQAVALLKQRSPTTAIAVTEGTTQTLLPELWQGRLDMVVGRLPEAGQHSGLEERELFEEPVVLMTGAHHPLTRRPTLEWSDLLGYPWVLPPVGSLLREPLERAFEAHGITLDGNIIETLSRHVTRAYLRITDAIAVMASTAADDPGHPLATLPLALTRLMRPAGVLWNRNRGLSPSAKLMLDCLELAAQPLRDRHGIVAA